MMAVVGVRVTASVQTRARDPEEPRALWAPGWCVCRFTNGNRC